MNVRILHCKRALRTALLILLLGVAGMSNVLAYDFEADNLLYTIVSTDPPMVSLDGHIDGTSASDELVIPETVEYEGDEYAVVAIGDYAFADCTDMYGDIDIPNSVLSIGSHAFDNAGFDGNLILGGSVASIGSYAFANLGSTGGGLTIPNSVTEIGDHAFYQSYFDGSFALSNSVTSIGAYAFYNLNMVTANPLNLSSFPLTTIGEYAFYNCKGMTGRLTLPIALTSLGAHAFEGAGFTQLNFGSTTNSQLQSIGEYAFAECTSMTGNLAFPNNLQSVGDWAFYNSKFNGNLTLRNVQTIGAHAFEQVPFNDKGLTIPASVTEIGEGAFASCFQGGSLTINANLTTIPDWAFSSCGFTAITIPNTVTTIGNNAFSYCSSVTGELTIPSTVTTIGDYAFYRTSYTGTLTIHENMASIGYGAFESCDDLTTLNYNATDCSLPEDGWVQYCEALTTLNIGENVEVIPDYAFRDCYYFTGDLVIPENIRIIGMQAFVGNNFTTIHFNAIDCESMGYNPETGSYFMVFRSNPSLQQIVIGDNVTQIPRFAFASHSSPNCTVVLGNSVEEIKRGAFYNGSEYGGITGELVIPSSVRYIRSRAFQGCWGLTGITVMAEEPPTVGDEQGTDTFDGVNMSIPVLVPCGFEDAYTSIAWGGFSNIQGLCAGTVTVAANPAEGGTVTGGGSFDGGQTCTVTATPNEGYVFVQWTANGIMVSTEAEYSFTVAGDMELVAEFASNDPIVFADDNVKAICVANWDTDGDGELSYAEAAAVTDLGGAFTNNEAITSFDELRYFERLNTINWNEFSNCSSLTSIEIPNSVTSIGGYAFYWCNGLSTIEIPSSVTSIGEDAFGYCSGLTSMIVLANTPPSLGGGVFYYMDMSIPVYVPCGYEEAYSSIGWGGFSSFMGMCSGTVTVAANPAEGGTVTGGGTFEGGQSCTVTATPNEGYVFVRWTANGRPVSTSVEYTFPVAGDMALVAHFASNGPITFADDNVKAICVSNWDTDGDGELSYAEAAAVTDLGTVFQYNEDILVFEELQYFISLTSIESTTFESCTNLTSIEIPNSVTSIEYAAFWNCFGLISIEIPNSVTVIGNRVFCYCSSLTSIEIPNSVIAIGNGAFNYCSGLEQIVVETGNTVYDSRDNCNAIIETATNSLIAGCKSTIIPNSVKTIGASAFEGCTDLTSIEIPNSVTSIEYAAFWNCYALTSIKENALTPPVLGAEAFNATYCPIYVPYESLAAYLTDWSQYEDRIYPFLQKSVAGYGESANGQWAFIASPLADNMEATAIENMTADDYDLYSFNQSEELEWRNHKYEPFELVNGTGYLYANTDDVELVFKGTFNEDETKETDLVYDAAADFAGWNLVGNPFPYAATVDRSHYVMNAEGTALEPTALSEGTSVAPCTGVMVKADTEGETVTFAKAMRQGTANNGLLRIAVPDGDKAIVSFNAGDRLEKFGFGNPKATISIPQGGKDYAIAYSEGKGEMPLNFKAAKNGEYTLTVDMENVDLANLHLIDNLTGADVDLLVSPEYTFTAKTTDYASRFRLLFSANENGDDTTGAEGDSFAFIDAAGNIVVDGAEVGSTMQIVDVTGRVVRVCTDVARNVSTSGMTTGVYVLRLINGDDVKTQKIVID
ncbi:MAG: leucine-rich repeat protein [Bacteroidales bacterium]|nr:leucine-rich repeat protein [Bacteroidales bacterium]